MKQGPRSIFSTTSQIHDPVDALYPVPWRIHCKSVAKQCDNVNGEVV
jgi:hypothetical protein